MKIKAVDYKGKHFILQDKNTLESMDEVVDWVDVNFIISENWVLKKHVADCNYYGIPAYIGADEELNKRIDEIEKQLNENNV